MTNNITDERLRFHATRSWTTFDCGSYDELQTLAVELLNARAEIERLKAELAKVSQLLEDVARSGVEIELRQYVTAQIGSTTWQEIQAWAKLKDKQ